MDLWDTCQEQLPDLNLERESFEWMMKHHAIFIHSFAKMCAVITSAPNRKSVTSEWRDKSRTASFITREIIVQYWEHQKPIKVSYIVDSIGFLVSESAIKKCFREGVRLKLLERTSDGYASTKLFEQECIIRMLEKASRKEVENWYELMHTYRSLRNSSKKLNQNTAVPRQKKT